MDSSKPGDEDVQERPRRESGSSVSSINSADLKTRRVQMSSYSIQSMARTRTVKDSVINLKTLSDVSTESEESTSLLPTSFWELVLHRWKTLVGTGVLAMPYAFAHSGWLVGVLCVIIINAGFRYCFQACLNIVEKVRTKTQDENVTFPEMIGIALESGPVFIKWLSRPWKYIWYVLYTMLMFGVSGTYILFIAVNMAQIYTDIGITWSIRTWVLLVYAAIAIISLIPNMRRIVPFTVIAAFLQSVGLILIMYFLVTNLPSLADRDKNRSISEMSIFLGIACFAGGPMSYVFQLDFKTKLSATAANVSALLSTLIYSLVGFFGYWKYGKRSLYSVTFNLPTSWEFPEWIRLLFIVGVFLLYINNLHNFVYAIWFTHIAPRLRLSPMWKQCCRYLFRFLFITLTMLLVLGLPFLGNLMSLSGICSHFIFGFVFVPAAELCCLWPDNLGPYNWKAIRNIAIISFGILFSVPAFLNNLYILFECVYHEK